MERKGGVGGMVGGMWKGWVVGGNGGVYVYVRGGKDGKEACPEKGTGVEIGMAFEKWRGKKGEGDDGDGDGRSIPYCILNLY